VEPEKSAVPAKTVATSSADGGCPFCRSQDEAKKVVAGQADSKSSGSSPIQLKIEPSPEVATGGGGP
jgi:hypothetical protein